jgi:NADPH:quinone reductase
VLESSIAEFKKGDFVSGNLDWKEYQVSEGKGLSKINADSSALSRYLGILGMTGLTAYFGLLEVA